MVQEILGVDARSFGCCFGVLGRSTVQRAGMAQGSGFKGFGLLQDL